MNLEELYWFKYNGYNGLKELYCLIYLSMEIGCVNKLSQLRISFL